MIAKGRWKNLQGAGKCMGKTRAVDCAIRVKVVSSTVALLWSAVAVTNDTFQPSREHNIR